MAGCGLSEDTFFSSFFYNYGSSWETPSNQVRGGSGPGGVAPCAPCRALTWHSAGRQRLGRGWGGPGPSGSHCLGQCQPARGGAPKSPELALQSPAAVAFLPCPICLPPPPPPNPAETRGRGRSQHVTPNNSWQNQGTRAQPSPSRRGRRTPVRPAPARPPVAPRGCGAVSPPRRAVPLPLPPATPGPRATSFPKMAAISSGGVP